MAKELGKIDLVTSGEEAPLAFGGRSEKAQATVYQKHMDFAKSKDDV